MDLKEITQKFKNIEFESFFDNKTLGIQISDDWLKIVECKIDKENIEVENFGQSAIETCVNQGKITNLGKLKKILKEVIQENNIQSKKANLSINNELVYNKIVEIPKENTQIQESIEWKIEEAFAVDIEEVYYDYKKIKENDTGNLEFNVIVLDKNEGDKYIKLLKSADLKLLNIELDNLSINKLIRKHLNQTKIIGILNIEEFNSNLSFFQDEHLIYNKNLEITGKDINEDIKKIYGNKISNPINFKEKNDVLLDEKISTKQISDLFYKVEHYINHFYSTHGEVIDKIYIVGKGLGMSNHFEEISEEIEMQFSKIDFYKLMDENSNITINTFRNFLVAIGSSLDEDDYNLLPNSKKQFDFSKLNKQLNLNFNFKSVISFLIMIFIITLIPAYNQQLETQKEDKAEIIQNIEDELFILQEETGELEKMKNEYEELKNEPKKLKETVGQKREWDGILKELEEILPEGSWINSFEVFDVNSFVLEGYVYSQNILSEIEKRGNNSNFIKNMNVQSINRDRIQRNDREYDVSVEDEVYQFEISGKLK